MGKVTRNSKYLSLAQARSTLAFDQPKLIAAHEDSGIVVRGVFLVHGNDNAVDPAGPIDEFDIEIFLDRYPRCEPKVFEVGDRIPREYDRHISGDGDCCVTVWEHWLATGNDNSFRAFVRGPLNEFFFSQHYFERHKDWPFGQRDHFGPGLQEAYAEALGVANKKAKIIYHLRLLSQDWPKGHWLCPCGSGKILRHCCRDDLMALHEKVPPPLARHMLKRLRFFLK